LAKLDPFSSFEPDLLEYIKTRAYLVPYATEEQRISHGQMFVEILGSGDTLDVDTLLALERMGWKPSYMLHCMNLYEETKKE